MKKILAVVLGLGFAAGLASTAQASPAPAQYLGYAEAAPVGGSWGGHPHDRCHGQMSGTAEWACGSVTGGPSGGLF